MQIGVRQRVRTYPSVPRRPSTRRRELRCATSSCITTYYFQIRVPAVLRAQYGTLVRLNLGTEEREIARPLALQLAAYWLTRFSAESVGDRLAFAPPQAIASLPTTATPDAANAVGMNISLRMADAFAYWQGLVTRRPERTVREIGASADDFDARMGIDLARVKRNDVARYRDLLLADGLAPATVTKRLGFIGAMLQTLYDAGRLSANVARGLRCRALRWRSRAGASSGPTSCARCFLPPSIAFTSVRAMWGRSGRVAAGAESRHGRAPRRAGATAPDRCRRTRWPPAAHPRRGRRVFQAREDRDLATRHSGPSGRHRGGLRSVC